MQSSASQFQDGIEQLAKLRARGYRKVTDNVEVDHGELPFLAAAGSPSQYSRLLAETRGQHTTSRLRSQEALQ